jgi:hypothetical protein
MMPAASSTLLIQARPASRLVGPTGGQELAPTAETQSLMLVTQVVAATFDGDDSVQLVEALLRSNETTTPAANVPQVAAGNSTPPLPVSVPGPAPEAPAPAWVAPAANEPTLPGQILKWLAVPAGVALLVGGWFWGRRGRKRAA